MRELTQLYLNIGEHDRARALVENAPDIYGSREFLKIKACDGKERAQACGEALLKTVRAAAELMMQTIMSYELTMTPAEKVRGIESAIGLFEHVCTDGNCGTHNAYIARMYTLMSLYLWLDGKQDEAFEALDESLARYKRFEQCCTSDEETYTAPLIRGVKMDKPKFTNDCPHTDVKSLAEDWPWWSTQDNVVVRPQIQSDPRWQEWVDKLK